MAVDVVALDLPGGDPGRFLQHESDEALVRMISAGHTAAFETVYDRHHRGLLAFCRHLLSSKEEAEDALQHTFASAYRALTGDGTPPIALKPWLYTIARNRCLTVLRARRPHEATDDEQADATVVSGLAEAVQQRADLRDLVSDLHRLPDDQRAALVLFEMGDHSHAEIATVLSVSREKVKALVFQAREGLLRARTARDTPCAEIRRDLSSRTRALPRRGVVRGHLDRCPACAAFDLEVRRQRAALAIVLPVVPSVGLKGSVLGPMLGGGASIAGAGGGAVIAGGGAAGVGAGAAGLASAGGAAGGASVAAGGIGGGGGAAAAIASGASGLAGAGAASGLGALAAKTVVAKALTVVAVATAAAGTTEVAREVHANHAKPSKAPATSLASATPAPVLPDEPTTTVSLPATHTAVSNTTTTTTTTSQSQTATTATTSTSAPSGGSTTSTGGGSTGAASPPSEPAADPGTGGSTAPPAAAAADPAPANDPAPAPDPTPAASDPGTVDPGTVVSADELPADPGTGPDGTPATDPNAPVTCPPGTEPAPTATDPATGAPASTDPATAPADVTVDPLATTPDPAATTAADPAAAAAAAIASGLCVAASPGAQSAPDPAAGAVSPAAAATATP